MAENETLDLWHPRNGRWRQLREKIESGEESDEIAIEIVQCLYRTFKKLVGKMPFASLLEAAHRLDFSTIRRIVQQCARARDYAEAFEQLVLDHSYRKGDANPEELIGALAHHSVGRFLDQIGLRVVGSGSWPDMARFRLLCEEVRELIEAPVAELARQISERPGTKPRMPARSAERMTKDENYTLSMSLLRRSGTHG